MPDPDHNTPPTLRERQSERVREEIRSAFVRLAAERGVQAFSMHDVAEAAGISHRTLYRYYPSRDALVEDILEESFTRVEDAKNTSHGPKAIWQGHPDAIAGAFEAFDRHADLVRTAARLRDTDVLDERHDARTESVRRFLAEAGASPAALDSLTVLVRMLTGSDAWIRMTSPEFGLDSHEAGLAAHWAVQVLVRAAIDQHGPLGPTTQHDRPTVDDRSAVDDDADNDGAAG